MMTRYGIKTDAGVIARYRNENAAVETKVDRRARNAAAKKLRAEIESDAHAWQRNGYPTARLYGWED